MLSLARFVSIVFIAAMVAAESSSDPPLHSACYYWKKNQTGPMPVDVRLLPAKSDADSETSNRPKTPTKEIAPGLGACGVTYTADSDAICLFLGNAHTKVPNATPGWVSGSSTANCGKKIWIENANNKGDNRVHGYVRDACPMEDFLTLDTGCPAIWVAKKLYDQLSINNVAQVDQWDFAHNDEW